MLVYILNITSGGPPENTSLPFLSVKTAKAHAHIEANQFGKVIKLKWDGPHKDDTVRCWSAKDDDGVEYHIAEYDAY
jgi:hypothetical protein